MVLTWKGTLNVETHIAIFSYFQINFTQFASKKLFFFQIISASNSISNLEVKLRSYSSLFTHQLKTFCRPNEANICFYTSLLSSDYVLSNIWVNLLAFREFEEASLKTLSKMLGLCKYSQCKIWPVDTVNLVKIWKRIEHRLSVRACVCHWEKTSFLLPSWWKLKLGTPQDAGNLKPPKSIFITSISGSNWTLSIKIELVSAWMSLF